MTTLHRNGKQNVSQDEIIAALLSKVSQLEAKLEAKDKHDAGITCKVGVPTHNPKTGKTSKGGGLVIYGLGRFPAHFYISQWDKLMANLETVQEFVAANRDHFTTKD